MKMINSQDLVQRVLKSNLLSEEDTSYIIYDLDFLENRFDELKQAFPENSLHGIAIKACPLPSILNLQAQNNLGAEAASIEEVHIALSAGIPNHKIIFDGPAKTKHELKFCLNQNIYINIDSFEELERVASLISPDSKFKAGLRLNPQIGMGSIGDTSVAGKVSKFGVVLDQHLERIERYFREYSWLVGVHVHIGSQGMTLEELVQGTKKVYDLTKNLSGLERFDLGGGLPVVYKETDEAISFEQYAKALRKHVPALFDGSLQILTEFGRKVFSDTAIAVSKIEYVKEDRQIVSHLGADMFLRRVYKPNDWFHQLSVLTSNAEFIQEAKQSYSVAGPLCFGGDFIERDVSLPKVKEGDLLIVHDVGAYTLSMWSRHCSRLTPKVVGVRESGVELIKSRETIDDLITFWS